MKNKLWTKRHSILFVDTAFCGKDNARIIEQRCADRQIISCCQLCVFVLRCIYRRHKMRMRKTATEAIRNSIGDIMFCTRPKGYDVRVQWFYNAIRKETILFNEQTQGSPLDILLFIWTFHFDYFETVMSTPHVPRIYVTAWPCDWFHE